MDIETIIAILGMVLGGGGLISGIVSWRELRSKERLNDSDAADKVSQAAAEAVKSLLPPLITRVDCLEAEITAKEKKITELENRVIILEHENTLLRKWAARLVVQVKELGGTPVSYDHAQ